MSGHESAGAPAREPERVAESDSGFTAGNDPTATRSQPSPSADDSWSDAPAPTPDTSGIAAAVGHEQGEGARIEAPAADTVGGTEVAVRRQASGSRDVGHRAFHDIFRPGANDWGLLAGDVRGATGEQNALVEMVVSRIRSTSARAFPPAAVLGDLAGVLTDLATGAQSVYRCSVVLARVELDTCGVWVTVAGAGHPRPIVVRGAGWVDVRGNASEALGSAEALPTDDRVGLGPGDALVVCTEAITTSRSADGEFFGEKVLPEILIDCVGQSANAIAGRVLAGATEFGGDRLYDDGVVMVLRAPEIIRRDGALWVSRSTGIPVHSLRLPGYPVGDLHPELWRERPTPPREALIRLLPEPPSIPTLRRLLRRLLQSWRMDSLAGGDIELLATEVATDVFSRTASPVTVVVRYVGSVIRVEVGDGARDLPKRRRRTPDDLSGHRLALLESLALDWGVSATATGARTWFEVSAMRAPPAESGLPGS